MSRKEAQAVGGGGAGWYRNRYVEPQSRHHQGTLGVKSRMAISGGQGNIMGRNTYLPLAPPRVTLTVAKVPMYERLTASFAILSMLVSLVVIIQVLPSLNPSVYLDAGIVGLFVMFFIPIAAFIWKGLTQRV